MDPSRVLPQVPLEVVEDLNLEAKQVKVLDYIEKEIKNKKIPIIKVLWRSSQIKEVTWERESEMRRKYPELLLNTGKELMIKGYIYKSMSLVLC